MKNKVAYWLSKALSPKYILTLCVAATFIYATVSNILTKDSIALIIMVVFKDYFQNSE